MFEKIKELQDIEDNLFDYENEIKNHRDKAKELLFWVKFPQFGYLKFKDYISDLDDDSFKKAYLTEYEIRKGYNESGILQRISYLGFGTVESIKEAEGFFRYYLPLDSKLEFRRPRSITLHIDKIRSFLNSLENVDFCTTVPVIEEEEEGVDASLAISFSR